MQEKLEWVTNILKNFGVRMTVYGKTLTGLENYDDGFRSRIYKTFDPDRLAEFLLFIEPAEICLTVDLYQCHYCFFCLDETVYGEGAAYCIIGPWLEIPPTESDINDMLEKNKIPYHIKPEIARYFNFLPLITFRNCWEGLLVTITEYLFAGDKKISLSCRQFDPGYPDAGYSPKQDSFLSLRLLEELYKNEDALLDAIQAGDTKRALQCVANFSYYNAPQRVPEKLRDLKNYLLVLNTLARKAVQNSAVHPMHIHSVSSDFAQRIEAVEKSPGLLALFETMIHRYCALVQEHSLGKFSVVVRNTINFVEFNLKEPLSLSILAKQFNIDPSNLSHSFTREMGMPLTDFINSKRLEYAKHLLAGSGMSIQEIAEECGFQDINYLCRLFKRKYSKTPREYRNSVHAGL